MVVTSLFFWNSVDRIVLISWILINSVLTIARGVLVISFRKREPKPDKLFSWGIIFACSSFFSGVIWGSISILFLNIEELETVLFVAIVITGMSAGSLVPLSTFIPAYFGFCIPALLPLATIMLAQDQTVFILIGFLVIAFIFVNLAYAFVVNKNLAESIELRFVNLDLLEDLKIQRDIAEKANKDKSRFLAAASHDLRQPLHAMDLYLGALENLIYEQNQKEILTKTHKSSKALNELLESLMDISKFDSDSIDINFASINVRRILEELFNEFKILCDEKNISLRLRAKVIYIHTDPVLLKRNLRNLISNAMKHSQANKILISARKVKNKINIEVRDNGVGIPSNEKTNIFSEFYQLNNPERDRNKGLGLGLAIVRRVCKLLNHEIILISKINQGCCFRIITPESKIISQDVINTSNDRNDISGLFIIFIDDEKDVLEATSLLLRQWDCEILARDSLRSINTELDEFEYPTPDLLISDYRLPNNATGIEAITSLRKKFEKEIPAILISGDVEQNVKDISKEKNCYFLSKPVNPDRLRNIIYQANQSNN